MYPRLYLLSWVTIFAKGEVCALSSSYKKRKTSFDVIFVCIQSELIYPYIVFKVLDTYVLYVVTLYRYRQWRVTFQKQLSRGALTAPTAI